jgi:hypothetical protein
MPPIYEKVDEFNSKTLNFLRQHSGAAASASN